ncbi:hypothetical protein ACE6H2_027765 [Prunus campanulata]
MARHLQGDLLLEVVLPSRAVMELIPSSISTLGMRWTNQKIVIAFMPLQTREYD